MWKVDTCIMAEYDFNSGFERLEKTWAGQGDRPPVFAQLHEFAMRRTNVSGEKFYNDPEVFTKGILNTAQYFNLDIPDVMGDVYNIEAQALGARVIFNENTTPDLDRTPLIENEKDLAALKIPDPEKSGRYVWVMDCMAVFEELTRKPAGLGFCSPMTLAVLLVGYEKLVMAIYNNPEFVHKLLTVLTEEVTAPYINAVFKKFKQCPSADGADALSSLPFLTQDMVNNFCVPYILLLKELCGERVVVRNWWGDSFAVDLEAFWDTKLKIGNNILEVQDPDLFKIGPEKVIQYATKKNIPVIFGVDQTLLALGTLEQIDKRVKQYVDTGAKQRKLGIYLCSLSAATPEENVFAAVSAVHKYGYRYYST